MNQEGHDEIVQVPPAPTNDRLLAVLEIFFCSGIASQLIATVPFFLLGISFHETPVKIKILFASYLLESLILFGLIAFFQRLRGERVKDLGFDFRRLKKEAIIGLASVPGLFLVGVLVSIIFKYLLPKYYMDKNPLLEFIATRQDLVLFLIMVTIAGIKEELQRAFILLRFERYLMGAPLGLLFWSMAFGAFHYLQGFQGVVNAVALGLIFGILFLTRRSLISPIIAHTAYDVSALLLFWSTRGK